MKQDSSAENVDIPVRDQLEEDNDAQQDVPFKEEICANPESADLLSDNPTSDNTIPVNIGISCFFCNKTKKNFGLNNWFYIAAKKNNLNKAFYNI